VESGRCVAPGVGSGSIALAALGPVLPVRYADFPL
jgi:hypothetical protein